MNTARSAFFRTAAAIWLCLFAGASLVRGAADPDIIFQAGFDGTVAAQAGKRAVKPSSVSGELRFEEGVKGKALVAGEAGALLHYAAKGSVAPKRGAIAMWVKAVDWTPEEEAFHIFFMSSSKTGWVQLYKYLAPNGGLLMLVGKGGGRPYVDYWHVSGDSKKLLVKGRWVHLVGTWDAGRVALYANGEPVASMQGKGEPTELGETFLVGDYPWSKPRPKCKTLIDEFRIYRRPLSPGEVKSLYRSYVGEEEQALGPHRLTVFKTTKPPKIDGVLTDTEWTEPEWGNAAALTGFIDLRTKKFATRQARAWFTWDDERLYFALASDIEAGSAPVANITRRDGAVWGDDAVEFFIAPPDEAGKEKPVYFQLLGNAANVILDNKSNDMSWNGPWSYATKVFGQYWVAEGSIRWADLGLDAPEDGETWRVNFARDWQNPKAWTVWGHTANFHEVKDFVYITFRDVGVVAQVESLGAFTSGNVAFDVSLAGVRTAKPHRVVAQLSFGDDVTEVAATVSPGARKTLEFRTTIKDPAADTMKLRIASETTGDVLWEGTFPFDRTNPIIVELEPLPSEGVIEAKIDISGMAPMPKSPAAKLIFAEVETAKETATFACAPFNDRGRSLTRLPMDRIPVGAFKVSVLVLDGEKPAGETTVAFDRHDEPWRGNTVGLTDRILPGWTPIAVDNHTLSCWGRDVAFDGTLFPSSMVTRDEEVLAGPIRLDARADGGKVEWKDVSFEIVTAAPDRVDFVTAAGSDKLRVVNDAYLEYDGMFFFRTTIAPVGGNVKLDSLALVIPFQDERAVFWHWPGGFPKYGGKVPSGTGALWRQPFRQYMWLGDYDRGLTWFTEDNANWNISDGTGTLELFRKDGVVEWRVHIADAPVELEGPLTITVGLHPTPVKPQRKGWRMFSIASELGQSPNIKWTNPSTTLHFGYPQAPDPAHIKRLTDDAHLRGMRVIPYMHAVRLGEMSPEWQFYGRDWAMPGVIDSSDSDVTRFQGALLGVCPAVKDVRDWFAWKNEHYLDSTGYDGLYYDHSWPYRCSHAKHDHAPGAIPLIGYREQYRRLYTLVKERDPDGFVAAHVSGGLFSPMMSWTDVTIPGEELVSPMMKAREREETKDTNDLFDVIPFDYYHAWCTGRQFGQAPVYLAPVWSFAKHHNCFMLLTDSIGGWRYDGVLLQLYQDLGMGADDVEFLPFWDNGHLIQTRADRAPKELDNPHYPDPLTSAWRRPGKFVLFAVCNMTKADRTVTVAFDAPALGFDPSQIALTDAYPRHPLLAAAPTFTVDVKGHSYRLVLLTAEVDGKTLLYPRPDADAPTPIPALNDRDTWLRGEAPAIAGSGRLRGRGETLLLVGDASHDQDAPLPQESRLAQTFTLAKPARIQSLKAEVMESGGPHQIPCDLRIHKLSPDGTPSDQLAHPRAWAWMASRPGTLVTGKSNFYTFRFKESFVLPAGRYAFVLSKRPSVPENRHHYAFTLWPPDKLPNETALTWTNTHPTGTPAPGVISLSVFAFNQ